MSATGGKVGTGAGLGSFWLLSVEDLQALCIDASKTRGTGLWDFFRCSLQDLQVRYVFATAQYASDEQQLELQQQSMERKNIWIDPSIQGRSAATMK